jgi:hypothetical protein
MRALLPHKEEYDTMTFDRSSSVPSLGLREKVLCKEVKTKVCFQVKKEWS